MFSKKFLVVLITGISISVCINAFLHGNAMAAGCPVTPIKGAMTLFMSGSYLDVQLNKNPDLHKNQALEKSISDMNLKPFKLENFPYTGANSSNWLFLFDFGCQPAGPITLTLTNKAGKKISVTLEPFEGNRYVAILNDLDSESLSGLFGNGTGSNITLSLTDGKGGKIWQSGTLKTYRPRNGGQSGAGGSEGGGTNGGGSGSGNSGSGCPPEGCDGEG